MTVSYTTSAHGELARQTAQALHAAEAVAGADKVDAVAPMMVSEDFGAFLEAGPSCSSARERTPCPP